MVQLSSGDSQVMSVHPSGKGTLKADKSIKILRQCSYFKYAFLSIMQRKGVEQLRYLM